MSFKSPRPGILMIVIAAMGTLLLAMPLLGVGADVSPDADRYLERRYGNIGMGLAVGLVALMTLLAVTGLIVQFLPPMIRRHRGQSREQVRRSRR